MINNWPEKEKPGWHEITFNSSKMTVVDYLTLYRNTVDWVMENVENPYRHVHWGFDATEAIFRFRHERDYLRFVLRWR